MKIFVGITMQAAVPGGVMLTESYFDELDWEGPVRRIEVLNRIKRELPSAVRNGAIVFFTAEPAEVRSA